MTAGYPALTLPAMVTRLQVIIVAFVFAGVIFSVIAVTMQGQLGEPIAGQSILSLVALLMAFTDIAARFILVRVLDAKFRQTRSPLPREIRSDETPVPAEWLSAYMTRTIISAALFQGCMLFALVAFMLEGEIATLVLAGLLIPVLLFHLPTAARIRSWIRSQQEKQEAERELQSDGLPSRGT
jgi:hypothetical protein